MSEYKLTCGLSDDELIQQLISVRDGITDAQSYQRADFGVPMSNLDDIIRLCKVGAEKMKKQEKGHWIVTHEDDGSGMMRPYTHCSVCGLKGRYMSQCKFCPQCGVPMI